MTDKIAQDSLRQPKIVQDRTGYYKMLQDITSDATKILQD